MSSDTVLLDHGGGGRAASELISGIFISRLGNPILDRLEDSAELPPDGRRAAMTTDGYVIDPPFFPGGDIGSMAVHGTVNDLAMRGAQPAWLTAGFILEEGLPLADLERIVTSMARAAREAGVAVVAGDTKVVNRGAADRIFITTAGVGYIPDGRNVSVANARPGDAVLISGTMGDHGLTVMATRRGLALTTPVKSDSAPLNGLVEVLCDAVGGELRSLRDATRGGLAAVLNEMAVASGVGLELEETAVPVDPAVAAACEVLGLDPYHLANEGKMVAVVSAGAEQRALAALRDHPLGRRAAVIGRVTDQHPGRVVVITAIGGSRVMDVLTGEQLPRIC